MDGEVFLSQWDSINSIMEAMKQQLNNEKIDEKPTLINAIESLQIFTKNQFEFFHEGFYGDKPYLRESDQYPPQNVLQTLLFQISHDVLMWRQVINQRRSLTDNNGDPINQNELNTLKLADFLANEAMKPAQGYFSTRPKAITYFQKSPAIRVIPYAPVALIGIPYSCIESAADNNGMFTRNLLAIPHEVGHYVFWHGKSPSGERLIEQILDKLPSLDVWAMRWVEEIFADVYGSLIAGPIMGVSAQDLQLLDSQDGFISDDSEHPVPTLRPYIYSKVIHEFYDASANAKWGTFLDNRWNGKLDNRNREMIYKQRNDHNKKIAETINPSHTLEPNPIEPVDTIVQTILGELRLTIFRHINQTKWSQKDLDNLVEDENALYVAFTEHISKLVGTGLGEAPAPELNHTLPKEWNEELQNPKANSLAHRSKILTKDWKRLFEANGWATRGPTDNPPIKTWIRL